MSRPHRRALAWLARHPTVLLVAVAFTASVAVAAVGDIAALGEFSLPAEMDFETTGIGSQTDGPNTVDDGGSS